MGKYQFLVSDTQKPLVSDTQKDQKDTQDVPAWMRFLPILAILALTALTCSQLLGRSSTALFSNQATPDEDLVLHLWQYAWVEAGLRNPEQPAFTTDMLSFPAQLDLTTIMGGHLDLLLGTPLVALAGPVLASNAIITLLLACCGLCVCWLALAVTGDRLAATLAGMLYMTCPLVLREALEGRPEELCFCFVALVLLFLGRWYVQGRRRDLALAALAGVLSVFSYMATALLSAFLLPALGLGFLLAAPSRAAGDAPDRRALLARTALLAGLAALITVPLLVYGAGALGSDQLLPQLLRPDTPQSRLELQEWIGRSSGFPARIPHNKLFALRPLGQPPASALLLPLLALPAILGRASFRRALPWLLGAVLMHLLALGPYLLQTPAGSEIPSPYQLLAWIVPSFLRFHWPYRFLFLGNLCLAVLGAISLSRVFAQLRACRQRRAAGLALGATALILAILQVHRMFPLPVADLPPAPQVYRQLEEEPAGALFALLPAQGQAAYPALLAQMAHARPLCCLQTPTTLAPAGMREIQQANPTYDFFSRISRGAWPVSGDEHPQPGDLAALRELGFSHVVAQEEARPRQKHRPSEGIRSKTPARTCQARGTRKAFLTRLLGKPIASQCVGEGEISVFRIPGEDDASKLGME